MGLFSNDAGNTELEAALKEIRRNTPTGAQLTLPELKKYVAAGVLTPQQYQAIIANPQAYQDAFQGAEDNTGKNAQSAALQQLGSIVQSGGSSPINQANLENNINQTNQAMQAARGGIENQAQQRGVSGGGLEFISKLMNEQANSQNAHMGAVQAGSDNAKLALEALTNQGNLGSTMQGQSNQSQQAQAEAARQIAQYNSQLQSTANQYNTQNANQAQQMNLANSQDIANQNVTGANQRMQYNAQIPQQLFNNAVSGAGASNVLAQQKSNQQAQKNAFTGNLIGTGATVIGGMYGGPVGAAAGNQIGKQIAGNNAANSNQYNDNPYGQYAHGGEVNGRTCYAQGGEVHDHQLCMQAGGPVPGEEPEMPIDDMANDTVPANLSPGEIVLPNSVTQAPNAPAQAERFVSQTKGQPPMGGGASFTDILAQLETNGLELRLASRGQ